MATKGSTSSIDVFSVDANGSLGATPVVKPPQRRRRLRLPSIQRAVSISAEAGVNAIRPTHSAPTARSLARSRRQMDRLARWIVGANGNFYVANAGSATISGYTVDASGKPSLIGATGVVGQTEAGAIDMAATSDGRFLYAESGGAGTVDVFAGMATGR